MRVATLTALCVLWVSAFHTGVAHASSITTASVGSAQGCRNQACTQQTLRLGSTSGGGTGTLGIAGDTLTFSITLASTTLVPISGASDNGVTQLVFSNTTYSGSALLTPLGGGFYGIASGSASIHGTQTPAGAGTAGPFSAADVQLAGSCVELGTSVSCGIVFGPARDFSFDVNGRTRYFSHTVNLTAVIPEPAAGLLYGVGLLISGSAVRRRPRVRCG